MEKLTENDNAGAESVMENDNAGAGSVMENDNAGAENGITGAEYEIAGAEGNTDGTEILMAKAENSLVGDENNIAGDHSSLVGAEDNMARTVENTELQQGHNNDSEVINSEKRWPGWPGESVFRILVPSHKVGGIIGRKGEFIKKICEESKARIKIIEAPQGAPERAVMVSAKEEQDASISPAMDGLLRIHKRVVDGLDGEASAPQNAGSTVQTRMLVGASQAGTLIGKHGATIKSIQEASSCIVRVVENVPPFALHDDKIVEIQGQPTGVHKALELVASHLRKFLVDRSVIPLFESQMSRPIPEMQPNMPPPPEHWGHHQGLPPNGGGGFGGNPQFMPPRPHDNFYRPPEMPPFEKPPHHGISAFGRDVPPMGGYPSSNQHGQPVTQHMQVPLSYADAVIGAAGANISYIRRASGATITIQETAGIPGEMTVEINGTATQIQTAQQLVQNFMAEVAPPAQNAAAPVDPYGSSYGPSYSSYSAPQANAGPAAGPTGGYGASYGAGYGY